MYQIENDWICLTVNPIGAEMFSVHSKKDDFEYLWDGNPDFWKFHAPICFPIIGTLKEDQCTVGGSSYHMTVHGFARDMPFSLVSHTKNSLTLKLSADPSTLKKYPFLFELTLTYTLDECQIMLQYEIHNIDEKPLFFSIGAHTAYRCPLEQNETFNNYFLEFEEKEDASCILLENGKPTKHRRELPCAEGILPLNYELFKDGILILDQLKSKKVTLCSEKSKHKVTVDFQGFPYLGIWTKADGCPFLCIEPWDGLPDDKNADGNLKNKTGVHSLEAGKTRSYSHTMLFS